MAHVGKHGKTSPSSKTLNIPTQKCHDTGNKEKINFPICNAEYSNLTPLLIHVKLTSAKMTWPPKTCNILEKSTRDRKNNVKTQRGGTKLRNRPDQTLHGKIRQNKTYIENSSKKYNKTNTSTNN